MAGVTERLALAPVPVPTSVVYPALEYHLHTAPVPRLPPLWVNVVLLPVQMGDALAASAVGATEG